MGAPLEFFVIVDPAGYPMRHTLTPDYHDTPDPIWIRQDTENIWFKRSDAYGWDRLEKTEGFTIRRCTLTVKQP